MTPINAFTMVRPRGPDLDIPAKPPKSKASQSSETNSFGTLKALDRLGRPTVTTQPRTQGGITLNTRRPSAATLAKQARAGSKAGTK